MKQTAVEFLVNEMPVIDWSDPYWKVKLDKAKEMEKEQIIDAYNIGTVNGIDYPESSLPLVGDIYYNENFK